MACIVMSSVQGQLAERVLPHGLGTPSPTKQQPALGLTENDKPGMDEGGASRAAGCPLICFCYLHVFLVMSVKCSE